MCDTVLPSLDNFSCTIKAGDLFVPKMELISTCRMVLLTSKQLWNPINITTSKAIGRIFNSIGYFLPANQKACRKKRPGQSTSAAGSASTSAACQQAVCGTSARTQTLFFNFQKEYFFQCRVLVLNWI